MTDSYSLFNEEVDVSLIDRMTLDAEKEKWPAELRYLYLTLTDKLKELELSESFALPLLVGISENMGGGQFYLPKGEAIKRQLRDIQIYELFNGRNIRELAKRFGVADATIYKAIARMRESERSKYQLDLFERH